MDDDVYVNVPQLNHLLQQYDPNQPYYLGRWIHDDPSINVRNIIVKGTLLLYPWPLLKS